MSRLKPSSPPRWVLGLVGKLNSFIPTQIDRQRSGWCCVKHELDYSPKELTLIEVSVEFQLHHYPVIEKFLRMIYKIVQQEVKEAKTHELVHFLANPTGFTLAIKSIDVRPEEKGDLNVDL
jgi:hypothetical protein